MESSRSAPTIKGRPDVVEPNDVNMEDVPLPNINQHQSMPELNKNNSNNANHHKTNNKTASLRRFFKLSKKTDKEQDKDRSSQLVLNELPKENGASHSGHGKRFGLSLLSSNHFSSEKNGREMEPSSSKATLKSSFSAYWNTLFKKNKKHSAMNLRSDVENTTPVAELESNNVDSSSENQGQDLDQELHQQIQKQISKHSYTHNEHVEDQQTETDTVTAPATDTTGMNPSDNPGYNTSGIDSKAEAIDATENQIFNVTRTERNQSD